MPTNVLAVGLFAVTGAFRLMGLWLLKLKPFQVAEKTQIDRAFATAIGAIGAYAAVAGFSLLGAEPLRAPYNEFFGLIHVYYGMVLLVGTISLWNEWDLRPASYLAFLGGIINLIYVYMNETLIRNSSYPLIFGPAALVGLTAPLATHLKSVWVSRMVGILCLILAGAALYIGANAIVGHVARGLKPA